MTPNICFSYILFNNMYFVQATVLKIFCINLCCIQQAMATDELTRNCQELLIFVSPLRKKIKSLARKLAECDNDGKFVLLLWLSNIHFKCPYFGS